MNSVTLVKLALFIATVNTLAISRINGFPRIDLESIRYLRQLSLDAEPYDKPIRASNTTSVSTSTIVPPSSLISQLLTTIGSAIVPALGPFAPLATSIGGVLSNYLTGLFSREFTNRGGTVERHVVTGNRQFATYHITLPDQGTYILMTQKPSGANEDVDNMLNLNQAMPNIDREKDHRDKSNDERLVPLAKLIWQIIKLFNLLN